MKFYEKKHKYIDNDIEYVPVTYFLKTFESWKDWEEIAAKKAKKLKISKEELLKQWEDEKNKASLKGTCFHKHMENKYCSSEFLNIDGNNYNVNYINTKDDVKEDNNLLLENNTFYVEKMVWSSKYKICGTADLVEVIDNKINIKDYKTNKELKFEAWKHPIKGPDKLKFPVNHLDDCNGNKYNLQLNTYMYLLLMQNRHLKMGDMTLLHVIFNDENDLDNYEIVPYKVPNLIKEVSLMLNYFKDKR